MTAFLKNGEYLIRFWADESHPMSLRHSMPACLAPIFSRQKKGGLKNPPESIHEMRVNICSPLEETICS
jgi:hypothetical protein